MLRLYKQFEGMEIVSLRAGHLVGHLGQPILNPEKFSIEAFYCASRSRTPTALLTKDIRESSRRRVVINEESDVVPLDDLVRLQELIEINFQVAGKKVTTQAGRTVGKVTDFIVNDLNFQIQTLHVKKPVWQSIAAGELIIDRSQVVEVTDEKIVVKDTTIKVGASKRVAKVNLAN